MGRNGSIYVAGQHGPQPYLQLPGFFSVRAYGKDGDRLWTQESRGRVLPWPKVDWAAAGGIALDKQGRVHVTGGTVDPVEVDFLPPFPAPSAYLTNVYAPDGDGDPLWSREF